MCDNKNNKEIFSITHAKPREYAFPKNIEEDLEGNIDEIAISETGKFLFAASKEVICIYNYQKEELICKYNK